MTPVPEGYTYPSRKRQLLAIYLDFLLFEALYRPLAWLGLFSGLLDESWVKFGLFGLARLIAWMLKTLSPGQRALGIRVFTTWGHGAAPALENSRLQGERWWTLAAGVVLVLEGSKNLVRWTHGLPAPPFLGESVPEVVPYLLIALLGALNIGAGLLVLRNNFRGAAIGIGVLAAEIFGVVMNRAAFGEWAAVTTEMRRQFAGRELREGELEFVKAFVSTYAPAMMAAGIIWLGFVFLFHRAARRS